MILACWAPVGSCIARTYWCTMRSLYLSSKGYNRVRTMTNLGCWHFSFNRSNATSRELRERGRARGPVHSLPILDPRSHYGAGEQPDVRWTNTLLSQQKRQAQLLAGRRGYVDKFPRLVVVSTPPTHTVGHNAIYSTKIKWPTKSRLRGQRKQNCKLEMWRSLILKKKDALDTIPVYLGQPEPDGGRFKWRENLTVGEKTLMILGAAPLLWQEEKALHSRDN